MKWRADRQVGRYAVGLKLERLPVRNRETPSKGRDTEKVEAFISQQNRDVRWATVRKAECRSPKARGNFEQESEQKRQQWELLPVERALQPSALYRCRSRTERRRQDGQKKPAAERVMEPRPQGEAPDGSKGRWKGGGKVGRGGKGRGGIYAMGKRRGAVGARLARSGGRQTRRGRHL